MKSTPGLLNNRNFLFLWLGQLCSQFGDRLTQLVLVGIVAARGSSSTLTLAKVLVATSLPALLINPLAGAYVDRWDRKRTMIICDLIRAGLILSLPVLVGWPHHLPFYLVVFGLFAVASFFIPARLALIPDLVPADRLNQANALFTTSGMIGSTVILLAGALLVEWFGITRNCWVNAAGYLASAAFIVPISRRKVDHSVPPATVGQILRETRQLVGLLGFLMAGAGASVVVATVLIQRSLGSVTKDVGIFSLWMGVGMLAGAMAYSRWGWSVSRRKALGLAFLGCGAALWGFVGAVQGLRSGVAASAVSIVLGFCLAPVGIVANTLVHERHPERLHGRIFSSLGVVVNGSLILSMLMAGIIVNRGGHGLFLASVGGAFALSGIALLYYRR